MYEYKRLQTASSTRLIELRPGSTADVISCSLHHVDLSAGPTYEALSYVWGDRTNPATIVCDGAEMNVTQNLADALHHFRPAESNAMPRFVWVDSICINQKDIPEREQQVRIMGKIYEDATAVLIWLGEERVEDEVGLAWACMKDLAERVYPRRQELINWNTGFMGIDEVKRSWDGEQKISKSQIIRDPVEINHYFDIKPADSPEFQAIRKIFQRTWFSRAWTFQENFLAKQTFFNCGSFSMSGQELTRVHLILMFLSIRTSDSRYFGSDLTNTFNMVQGRHFWKKNPKDKLLELLGYRRGAGCENPSDLIYSLLSSAKDTVGIQVDYSKPFEKVFAEISFRHVTTENSLSILGCVNSDSSPSTLPYWVPDWRVRTSHRRFTDLFSRTYNSTSNSKLEAHLSLDARELILRGLVLDRIAAVETESRDFECVKQLIAPISDSLYPPTGETWNTVLERTRCADLTLFDPKNGAARWGADAIDRINHLADVERGPAYMAYLTMMIDRNQEARLIATEKGKLGIVSKAVQVDDLVCLMLGGEVPLVLRKIEGKYRFVGECYLHGFMDGEGLIEARKRSEPDYDVWDKAWLDHLHEGPLSFETQEFCLI